MCVLCYTPALVVGDSILFGGPMVYRTMERVRALVGLPPRPETESGEDWWSLDRVERERIRRDRAFRALAQM